MFKGSIVAIVTPFRNGQVDFEKLRELVEFQIEGGTDAIVPCGTTGETPTLTRDEWLHVIDVTIEVAAGRVPIVAGIERRIYTCQPGVTGVPRLGLI